MELFVSKRRFMVAVTGNKNYSPLHVRTGRQTVRHARGRVVRHCPFMDSAVTYTQSKPYEPGFRPVFRSAALIVGGK